MRTETGINWQVLREIALRDKKWAEDRGDAAGAWAFSRILDSMHTLEFGAESTKSLLIDGEMEHGAAASLAGHTAAACDTIIEAGR